MFAASPLKKIKYYDFETKLKVILDRQKGISIKTIQKKFQIVAVQQIYRWIRWFKNKEFHRLQQKRGHSYKHKTSINLNSHNNEIKKIKQQIKTIFQLKNQNFKKACLSIIDQYKNKFSLNQIIKWLGISKNSYYLWLKQKEQPPFLTNLDIKIQEICYQNQYYNNMGEGFFV
ncbi:helix-turn-helix domain-containing protein [Candidatus Phytoplasma sp. AldY-WA1]|uniref:helix-turn-helix domain-containing protein n=1 Tax=Candidatus Phytoplasma sp. AldY-WA1 TaxID=2852100 RepID=UPI00403DF22B